MRQIGYIILMMILGVGTLHAQPDRPQHMERIRAIKVAYLTEKIHLSTSQSERFWPVYHQYEDEMFGLRHEYFEKHGGRKHMDENARQSIDDDLEMQEKMLNIKKKYKDQFLGIISPQQLADLYDAEREFKKMLIQQLRERRGDRQLR